MNRHLVFFLFVALVAGCSKTGDKFQFPFREVNQKVKGDPTEAYDPRVDILFVIDNSGSMMSHQENLSKNINLFVNQFNKVEGLDFHVGVLNTDMGTFGGIGSNCCGVLQGTPRYVDRSTPAVEEVLAQNMLLGTDGSGFEESFSPVMAALTEPLLSGMNKGFYRAGAYLAIVFITDAEDQSDNVSVNDFLNFLNGLKSNPKKVLAYGAIVPSSVNNCQRDDGSKPRRIEEVLQKVPNAGNNVMSLCDPDFGDRLSALGHDLMSRVANIIYLKRIPIFSTIKVVYGNMELPQDPFRGWVYDANKNAIVLGQKIDWDAQPPGSSVQVFYEALVDLESR